MSATDPLRQLPASGESKALDPYPEIKQAVGLDLNAEIACVRSRRDASTYIILYTEPWPCGCGRGERVPTLIKVYDGGKMTMRDVVECLSARHYAPACPVHCRLTGVKLVNGTEHSYLLTYGREDGTLDPASGPGGWSGIALLFLMLLVSGVVVIRAVR